MPSIETFHRHQKAVLWTRAGTTEFNEPAFSTPIELDVRWEWTQEESLDEAGSPIIVEAMVVVDREIQEGSLMWLGELEDWYGTGSAGDDDYRMRVLRYNEVPDLKGRNYRRTVALVRFRGGV